VTANFPNSQAVCKSVGLSDQPGTARFLYRPVAPYLSSLDGNAPPEDIEHTVDLIYSDEYWNTAYGKATPRFLRWLPRGMTRWLVSKGMQRMNNDTVAYDCTLMTLSTLIDEQKLDRVDVLKIDVEGAEWAVLQGLDTRHWPLVQQVLVEVHDRDGRVKKCEALFREHGLTDVQAEQESIFKGTEVFNLIARRP
jgi:FkbM family methyltransferase